MFREFDFTGNVLLQIDRFRRTTGCGIKPLAVRETLDEESRGNLPKRARSRRGIRSPRLHDFGPEKRQCFERSAT
jgi:hypothetical protein